MSCIAPANAICGRDNMQRIDAAKSDRQILPTARARGLTLVEVMIVISIIILLTVIVLATMSKARMSAQATACLGNLRHIQSAFLNYAINNDGRLPPPASPTKRSWESFLSPYIGPIQAFRCPADSDIFPSVGSSYDWRDTGDPKTTLAGRLWQSPMRQDTILALDTLPGWHGQHLITAIRLNGAGQLMAEDEVFQNLQQSVSLGGR
jgi:type II secretory pathway pseudopilin PulG